MRRFLIVFRFMLTILALLGVLGLDSAHAGENPCREVAKVCRQQGYGTDGIRSSGAGLIKDCLQKVIAGQTLPRVQVRFETLSACKERWNAQNSSSSRRIGRDGEVKPNRRLASDEKSDSFHRRSSTTDTGWNEPSSFSPRTSQAQDATR